jgi:hypothetical protein
MNERDLRIFTAGVTFGAVAVGIIVIPILVFV